MKIKSMLVNLFLCVCVLLAAGCQGQTKATIPVQNSTKNTVVLQSTIIPPGQVLPVDVNQLMNYLMLVITGQPGTFILKGTNGYLFAFQISPDVWGWVSINSKGTAVTTNLVRFGGNQAANTTFADFVKSLLKDGWSKISPDQLPTWIKTALVDIALFARVLSKILVSFPCIIIMPGGNFDWVNPFQGKKG